MKFINKLFRYGGYPILMVGFGSVIVWIAANDRGLLPMLPVLVGAIAFSFIAERVIPYQRDWNHDHGDTALDWVHAIVNLTLSRAGLWWLPLFSGLAIGGGVWPTQWPFVFQVVLAVLILDLGIAAAHHASHRLSWLWRFHAVHHSVKRLYGFNGFMKHPMHQIFELGVGITPLLLLGLPYNVALTLPFLAGLALLSQHSNADYRTGPLKYIFANAEIHRFHHVNSVSGNVNFGLFTNLYDHMVGTWYYKAGEAPRDSNSIGIHGEPDYPRRYLDQLLKPVRPTPG